MKILGYGKNFEYGESSVVFNDDDDDDDSITPNMQRTESKDQTYLAEHLVS